MVLANAERAIELWPSDELALSNLMATALENYAALLRETDRDDEAVKLEARAKAIRETTTAERQAASQAASLEPEDQVTPTQSSVAELGTYDGDWILEIFAHNDRSRSVIVETKIIDGKFSVRFRFLRKLTSIKGEIDVYGRLTAEGNTSGGAWGSLRAWDYSTSYKDGSYHTVAQQTKGKRSQNDVDLLEFILTRATP